MFIAKIYDYVPVRTKVYELVDGVFKKSHRGKWGKEIDLDNPKCRVCNDTLNFKKKGVSKVDIKYITHYCSRCELYYTTFLDDVNNL